MTNEELILERLDRIEAQLAPISETAGSIKDLREDLVPLSGQAFRLLIRELEDVESSFQLEDLLTLFKRSLRSIKHIIFALEQLENIVDFVTTIEPLLKSAVPQVINYLEWALHNLERAADRVTNICEWVVYMVTGQYIEMDSEFEAPPVHR